MIHHHPFHRASPPGLATAFALLLGVGLSSGCGSDAVGGPADGGPGDAFESDALASGEALAWVHVGGSNRIDIFAADLGSGALSRKRSVPAGDDARLVELDPRRRRAFVQTQMGTPHQVLSYPIEPGGGGLGDPIIHPLPFPGVEGVTQMQVHPSAPWFMLSASNRDPGLEDQLMPLSEGGQLGGHRTVSYQFYGFTWDPSGKYFYGLDGEAIFQFGFEPGTGTLQPLDPPLAVGSSGRVVLSLCPHPGGRWVYSIEEAELGLYLSDPARGTLTAQDYLGPPLADEPTYWTSAVVHPDGRRLYVLGYLSQSRAAIVDLYAIDPDQGRLRFVARQGATRDAGRQLQNTGLQAPLLLGPDLLVIGGPLLDSGVDQIPAGVPVLVVYRLAAGDGRPTPLGPPVALSPAARNTVSFLYSPR